LYALYSIGTGTAIAVHAADSHVCILRADSTATATATDSGEVLCWGAGCRGQLVSRVCAQTLQDSIVASISTSTSTQQSSSSEYTFFCMYTDHIHEIQLLFTSFVLA
jgi:hypothetical protein